MKVLLSYQRILIYSFLSLFLSCQTPSPPVDLLLTNGKIWTGNEASPQANWVAISDGKITALGNAESPPPQANKTIDLEGRLTLPGFNDSHVHFASAGNLLLGINLLDVNDEPMLKERIQAAAARLPKGSWITGGDWGAYEAWAMGSEGKKRNETTFLPTKDMIDDLTPEHPVLVVRYDRKVGLANSLALEALNLESKNGTLEGDILRKAMGDVPDKSFERRVKEAERALEECRKWGVTTVQDMSPLDQLDVYNHLREEGKLSCRINFSPSELSEYSNMIEKGWVINWDAEGGPTPSGDEWVSFGTLKTHIDGIMGARTARFYEPYSDNPPNESSWQGGWRQFSRNMPRFKQMITSADSGGIQLRIHAIGDQANSILLDILDTLDIVNGPRDRRFRLVHAQVIAPDDFARFEGRNIIAEVQPYHVTDDMRWMEERIGYERCKGAYAFKTLEEAGCILSFGSDWPGTNASYYPVNPLMGLFAAVTRQTLKGEPEAGWFPEQRIDLETALKAYTHGGAFSAFEESMKGSLEVGKLADIAVLDTDLFETEPSEWLDAQVDYTIVGGEIVWER